MTTRHHHRHQCPQLEQELAHHHRCLPLVLVYGALHLDRRLPLPLLLLLLLLLRPHHPLRL
jgi:hypothetical protein